MVHKIRVMAAVLVMLAAGLVPAAMARVPEPTALVQIRWHDDADLDRVEAAGVPVYAHLGGEDGAHLLAGATQDEVDALRQEGFSVTILDADMAGAAYYFASVMPGQVEPAWETYGTILLRQGDEVLLRAGPGDAARLTAVGIRVRAMTLTPKPLRPSAPARPIPSSVTPDPRVQAMIDQVSGWDITQYTGDLSGEWPVDIGGSPYTIATRYTYSGTPVQKATQYVGDHLANLGLDVEYHTWQTNQPPNVIGELPGSSNPDDILIICGHLDSITYNTPMTLAPGADDNASGSVAVLTAADIMTQYDWSCTLRFALWTGEEQGLLGSNVYAQRSYNLGENILGVLNLDMIAWNTLGSARTIDLNANQSVVGSVPLAQLFADVLAAYGIDLIPEIKPNGSGASDHASFWQFGYPAILGIEDFGDFNPYYHSEDDLLEYLDVPYYTDFVKASVATFAHMGCLAEGAIDGHVTDASSGAPLAATLEMTGTLGMTYTTTADASGYYTQTVLPDTYDVKASALDYHPAFASVVVTNGVATRDLALLPIPRIVVSPAALTATLYTSQAVTHTLWITNAGTGLLDFAVHELSGTLPVDLPWLAAAPSAGTVPAGVGMPLSVTFDAAATAPGVYGGALTIDSDDPAAPQVQVPVTLTVAGACMPVEVLSVTAAAEGCVVSFGAALSGTVPYTYGWDLGAAGTYTDPAPVVDFGLSGTWPYTLTVANCGGAYHDVVTGTVDVACAPPFSLYLPLVVREG